jgi:hypothetical protein
LQTTKEIEGFLRRLEGRRGICRQRRPSAHNQLHFGFRSSFLSASLLDRSRREGGFDMTRQAPLPWTFRWMLPLALVLILGLLAPTVAPAAPEGQLTWAVHLSLAPIWFDPAETTGIITPFMFLYARSTTLS